MKLYTEEQVRKAINDGSLYSYINGDFEFKNSEDDIINSLTPIELPTDEEIKNYWSYGYGGDSGSAIFGAKWLRDKIKGGEDE